MFIESQAFVCVSVLCVCPSDDEYSACVRVTGILTQCSELFENIHKPAAPGST